MENDSRDVTLKVLYALEIATAVASLYLIARMMISPDAMIRLRMGGARVVSRVAKHQADLWTEIAGTADTVYWQARNTVL